MTGRPVAPFTRHLDTSRTITIDVLIAMLPSAVWGVYVYGLRCITIMALSVVSAVIFEFLFSRYILKSNSISDLSCIITGLLVAFALPVSVPLWVPVFASFAGIIIGKELFGGIGKNLFNPAATGICLSYALFPNTLNYFTKPFEYFPALAFNVPTELIEQNHVVTALDNLKEGTVQVSAIADDFYGTAAGSIGELSALLLLIGFAYLLFKRVIHFNSAFAYTMTIVLLSYLISYVDSEPIDFIKIQLFTGPTMLIMVFMLNDYTTTPTTSLGRVVFAVLLGAGIVGMRYYGLTHFGEYYVLLVVNALSPIIEKYTYARVFGSKIRTQP